MISTTTSRFNCPFSELRNPFCWSVGRSVRLFRSYRPNTPLPLDGAWDEEPPVPAGAGVTDNEERSSSGSSASDSDSSDSSSDSGSSCDATNLQLAGEHRSSVSPKVEGDCVLYQHSKTRTIHMMPKGSSERKFVCGRSATSDHKVFMSIVYTPNMRCKQCLNGRPLRDVGALNEALQSALKRQRSAGK